MSKIEVKILADGSMHIEVPYDKVQEFRVMVKRASNTWQDKSTEIRDFGDKLNNLPNLAANSTPAATPVNDKAEGRMLIPSRIAEFIAAQRGAYREGCEAFSAGLKITDGPYADIVDIEFHEWVAGYRKAQTMVTAWNKVRSNLGSDPFKKD